MYFVHPVLVFAGTSCLQRLPIVAHSPPAFALQMRAGRASLVDKTGAIADLLNMAASGDAHRVFFSCPRRFGKSTTLSTAGEMLAAGALPPGVAPWPGYKAVDTQALFGGLQVHKRILRRGHHPGQPAEAPALCGAASSRHGTDRC